MAYSFETTCVNSTAELIRDMVEQAMEVTWKTFRSHVHWTDVQWAFPFYSFRGEEYSPANHQQTCGFHIKDDYGVSFYKSFYNGKPCYYIVHSAVEYVWTKEE